MNKTIKNIAIETPGPTQKVLYPNNPSICKQMIWK